MYTENGRQQSGLDAFEWALLAEKYGVGELLLTSIDHEGVQKPAGGECGINRRQSHHYAMDGSMGGNGVQPVPTRTRW